MNENIQPAPRLDGFFNCIAASLFVGQLGWDAKGLPVVLFDLLDQIVGHVSGLRSTIETIAPSFAKERAMAAPIPFAPPVTSTTFPSRPRFMRERRLSGRKSRVGRCQARPSPLPSNRFPVPCPCLRPEESPSKRSPPGSKGHELTGVTQQERNLEVKVGRVARLSGFPVDLEPHVQVVRVFDLVRSREEGTERSKGIATFSFTHCPQCSS